MPTNDVNEASGMRFSQLLNELEDLHRSEVFHLRREVSDLRNRLQPFPRMSPPVPLPPADAIQEESELCPEIKVADAMVEKSPMETSPSMSPSNSGLGPESEGKRLTQNSESLLKVPVKLGLNRKGSGTSSLSKFTAMTIEEEDEEITHEESKMLRERMKSIFLGVNFEIAVAALLIANILMMAAQLQYHGFITGHEIGYPRYATNPEEAWPSAKTVFFCGDVLFAGLFTAEMCVRVFKIRCAFFRNCLNWIDFLVVCSSWAELFAAALPISPTFLRMLRLGKLLRALRVVRMSQVLESLQLLLKCIYASLRILFWSLVLLMVIQCSAGITISYMLSDYMVDTQGSAEARFEVFRYYGTFSKTLLTMFEVLFANWAPPCRVLIDNVMKLQILKGSLRFLLAPPDLPVLKSNGDPDCVGKMGRSRPPPSHT